MICPTSLLPCSYKRGASPGQPRAYPGSRCPTVVAFLLSSNGAFVVPDLVAPLFLALANSRTHSPSPVCCRSGPCRVSRGDARIRRNEITFWSSEIIHTGPVINLLTQKSITSFCVCFRSRGAGTPNYGNGATMSDKSEVYVPIGSARRTNGRMTRTVIQVPSDEALSL